ncbi:MAG TPA: PTS sugar transporter subunit IIA [Myxococcota bacterium]|nr:PTS sugar transporter subunit IIA [Myxococcota bacterium]
MVPDSPDSPVRPAPFSLPDALRRGGVHRAVAGDSVSAVLEAVTRLPGVPAGLNRAALLKLLLGREALASTALGGGIAVPHPRDPGPVRAELPTVLLCYLQRAVDWHALDGQLVRVVFLLLSPTPKLHLLALSQLAFALRDETFKALLDAQADAEQLLQRLER